MDESDPLTYSIIGAAIEVHRIMGPGLLESVYQACLEEELRLRQIDFVGQNKWPLIYKGKTLEDYFLLDIYLPGQLVVELESVDKLTPIFDAQLLIPPSLDS